MPKRVNSPHRVVRHDGTGNSMLRAVSAEASDRNHARGNSKRVAYAAGERGQRISNRSDASHSCKARVTA